MNAARQACRPKHQVLVLKCYPKFQKNNVEVKPNSSELSYLLYYASTRRSKLQKVGDFLDKRATGDVWKARIGNVQVTLAILKALIEKCPRDLPLFAGAVLRILRTILKSNDVTMVEDSVPVFETFCAHQDPANLAANQDYIKQYEEIVQLYAHFASKEAASHSKTPISWPVAIRFRKAGLEAINAVASSESLASETKKQLAVIIPVILLNIFSENGNYLRRLEAREKEKEEADKEQPIPRRQSISTVRTADTEEGDPVAAAGTTEDADKLAEEEVGLVALQALRHIFIAVNRGQLRLATSAVLAFISNHTTQYNGISDPADPSRHTSWPTTLLAMVCGWAPVQDRYAILVGAMETLIRSPIVEDDMKRQLTLATIIEYLLSSKINFIGLSVMDVLVGLISHTLLILQLGGNGSTISPHHQQTTAMASEKDLKDARASGSIAGGVVMEVVKEPSYSRVQLLSTLQKCMGSLANHVYYTDQISDMLSAVLVRLKPSPTSAVPSTVAAIEDPIGAVSAVASSASLNEKTHHTDFFSFETARLTALAAVKDILVVANSRNPDGASRSPVRATVWEGTQWLLRDPSGKVRKAYADAIITWLTLEMKKDSLRIMENRKRIENEKGGVARRAVSNASRREKSPKIKNTFLALLHLAIYENALQYVESESDLLLLHLLLTTLTEKLGVNAVSCALPMIFHLQEDIQNIENAEYKTRIGSLVHGYFWALSMSFEFETSNVGRALHAEISRRNEKGLWMKTIRVPPMPLDRIEMPASYPASNSTSNHLPAELVQTEALKPFDNRDAIVDRIADGYSSSLYSPPSSPPGSPARQLSMPILHTTSVSTKNNQLPSAVKQQLLEDWTRKSCISSTNKDNASSASVTGSKSHTSAVVQKRLSQPKAPTPVDNNYLGVKIPNGNLDSASNSPLPTPKLGSAAGSTSSVHSRTRVEDLKRVLSGSSAPRTSYSMRSSSRHPHSENVQALQGLGLEGANTHNVLYDRRSTHSSSSSSLVSADNMSDSSYRTAETPGAGDGSESPSTPAATLTPRPLTSHPDVPPVPPIPASLRDSSNSPSRSGRPRTAPSPSRIGNGSVGANARKSRSLRRESVGRASKERSWSRERNGFSVIKNEKIRKPDFSNFLNAIDDEEDGATAEGGRPPY